MLPRGRAWSDRNPTGLSAVFGLAVVLFGLVAAPFCRCNCGDQDAAAAAEAPACHGHAGQHGKSDATPDLPCEHAGCAGLTAAIPQLPGAGFLDSSPTPPVGAGVWPSTVELLLPGRSVSMRPGIDRDIGPLIPAPLFNILRP